SNTLGWRPDAAVDLDVAAFEHALAQADIAERQVNPVSTRAALEQALELYRGDLMPSCYDEWVRPERERLRQMYRRTLVRLVRALEAERDYIAAIQHAERQLRLDSLDEDAYASLMRLHALNNDRASALRIYHDCEVI